MQLLFLLLYISTPAFAQSSIVNDTIKECSQMEMGDATYECAPLAPWRLGKCPKGYSKQQGVIALDPTGMGTISKCGPRKCRDEDCCRTDTTAYSAEGCTDLMINRTEKSCRLIAAKTKCGKIPKGWDSAKSCPADFVWNPKPLVCE